MLECGGSTLGDSASLEIMNGWARCSSWEPGAEAMQIPVVESPSVMDNKLKFSDRLKALLKTESRQDIDPYVFSEPEPFTTKPDLSKALTRAPAGKTPRAKCPKRRKVESKTASSESLTSLTDAGRADGDTTRSLELRFAPRAKDHSNHPDAQRRMSRDHTLLYYPRAGDEISDSDSSSDELGVYQRHWFSGDMNNVPRSTRLALVRSQLRRRFLQLHKTGHESEALLRKRTRRLLQAAWQSHRLTASKNSGKTASPLVVGGPCGAEGCRRMSLPCTRHCSRHIMLNTDQLLFEHCTAKFSDNTQCSVPVFDVAHELPLCPEHARKRDNYHRKAQESKPKKSRKKTASPTIPRPPKNSSCSSSSSTKSRPKKRKRPPSVKPLEIDSLETDLLRDDHDMQPFPSPIVDPSDIDGHIKTLNNLNIVPQSTSNPANLNLGLGLGSLGLGGGLKVELSDHEVFAALDPTEHDFGNVLNNFTSDALSDLFNGDRNGEYEPSREEEEELERALEAVDKDVRNLERMGQMGAHGLLEPALLAQLMSDIAS